MHGYDKVAVARLIAGILLLFFGRRLFWLCVAAAGFAAASRIGTEIFPENSGMMVLIVALLCGVIGAVIAVFLQRAAIALAGFILGGYLALALLENFVVLHGSGAQQMLWFAGIIGGVIGAIVISVFFDWALIFLSSLAGALLVVEAFLPAWHARNTAAGSSALIFIVLSVCGVLVQSRMLSSRRALPPE